MLKQESSVDILGYQKRLCCSEQVFNVITKECVNEFLKHHPEFSGVKISQNFILHKISKFYLESK